MDGALKSRPRPGRGVLIGTGLVALAVLVAAVWIVVTREPAPRKPGRDQAPGTLLSSAPLTSGVPPGLRGWRISYATTDLHGAPVTATGTVVASPAGNAKTRPVLALAHGTTGVDEACAPSLAPAPYLGPPAALRLLRDGWVAVSPDYVGLGSPGRHGYLVGREEAHAVLDSVRAARSLLATSNRTVLWGHSQGGHAALWTASIAPSYAPDVELLGVAATAPATDLPRLLAQAGAIPALKVVASYIVSAWQPVHAGTGAGWVNPAHAPVVADIARRCLPADQQAVYALAARIRGPILQEGALQGTLGRLLDENVPRGPFAAPVLVGQGARDETVPVQLQRDWVAEQCAAGASLIYREYPGLGHATVVAAASPLSADLIAWTRDRLAGIPVGDSCGPEQRLQP